MAKGKRAELEAKAERYARLHGGHVDYEVPVGRFRQALRRIRAALARRG